MRFMVRKMLVVTSLVLVVFLSSCGEFGEELSDAMDVGMANRKELAEIERLPEADESNDSEPVLPDYDEERQAEEASRQRAEELRKVVTTNEEPPPGPQFGGIPRRSVYRHVARKERGVKFELVVNLTGENLEDYQYEVEIRDQSGDSKTFPMTYASGTIRLTEIVPAAALDEIYEFQVRYFQEQSEEKHLLREDWGEFSISR